MSKFANEEFYLLFFWLSHIVDIPHDVPKHAADLPLVVSRYEGAV